MAMSEYRAIPRLWGLGCILALWFVPGCLRGIDKGRDDSGTTAANNDAADTVGAAPVQPVAPRPVDAGVQVRRTVLDHGVTTLYQPDTAVAGAKDIDCLLTSSSVKFAIKYGSSGCFGGEEHHFKMDVERDTQVRGVLETSNGDKWIESSEPISNNDGRSLVRQFHEVIVHPATLTSKSSTRETFVEVMYSCNGVQHGPIRFSAVEPYDVKNYAKRGTFSLDGNMRFERADRKQPPYDPTIEITRLLRRILLAISEREHAHSPSEVERANRSWHELLTVARR